MQKNQRFHLTISALDNKGSGIGYMHNFPIHVPNTQPGDKIEVHITKVTHQKAYGFCVEYVTQSPNTITPPCPIAKKCGGCQLQHMQYDAQLSFKKERLSTILIEKNLDFPPPKIIPNTHPLHYRNKAQYTIKPDSEKGVKIGLSAPRSQHIINIESCAIQHPISNDILALVRTYLEKDPTAFTQLIIRIAAFTEEALVTLVTPSDSTPTDHPLLTALTQHPAINSLHLNVNPNSKWENLGPTTQHIWGTPTIQEKIGGLTLNIGVEDFFQANPYMLETLWKTALQGISLTDKTLVDVYCGSGAMTLYMSQFCKQTIGIEENAEAIKNANENAQENGIKTCTFHQADAETLADTPADIICLDPPRKGLTPELITVLQNHACEALIYISCNPESLARDLAILTEKNSYSIESITTLDNFSQTHHLETVVKLKK